jgi:DNA-binding transcriptional LysR family regulator
VPAVTPAAPERVVTDGRVMVGIVGTAPAEAALREAFAEADQRGAAVVVVAAGPAGAYDDHLLLDLVGRWAEKYPDVPVTTRVRRRIDAAVTLVAGTRGCAVAFVPGTSEPGASAVVHAVSCRAHCPVVVVQG